MSVRNLLLVAGGASDGDDGSGVPSDPSLTELRAITTPYGMNQNTRPDANTPVGGTTVPGPSVTILEDAAELRLLFHGASQGFISDPMTIKVALKKLGGTWTPVTQGGNDAIVVPIDEAAVTDPITGPFLEGQTLEYRVYFADGQTVNVGMSGMSQDGGDYRLATSLSTNVPYPEGGPFPIAFIGKSRATVKTIGVFGDSIAAQQVWFTQACDENGLTGINYGRNVQRFDGRWLDGAVDALTHMLVQFGVNDLNGGRAGSVLWDFAVDCYAYIVSLSPGIPIWQATPTPMVSSSDLCATLDGQTFYDATIRDNRQAWCAFLRDGAPCHPDTKAALSVGATGTVIRAGHTDHPLRGIVDIAAAVEQGGSSSPTGKWRVDLGPLGGDGVHPSNLGMSVMAGPTSDWMATLT